MAKTISLIKKWRNISVEKKIIVSWVFSLLVIISISTIIYLSKKELHESADTISLNAKISSATQDLLSSIQKLEIISKRFKLTGSELDFENYFENLDSLKVNMDGLESLIKDQPSLYKHFMPLNKIIKEELYDVVRHSFSLKTTKLYDSPIVKMEEDIYKKLGNYLQLLDAEEDQITVKQVQGIQSKININLNYFLILVFLYVILLTGLFAIILSDVRERRKISQELSESRNNLKAIIDTAVSLIFVKNTDKKFTLVNKSFLEYFNINDYSSLISQDNSNILRGEQLEATIDEDNLVLTERKILKNIERIMIVNNNEQRWLSVNKSPLIDNDGKVVGIVGVMDDITKRKMYEAELHEAKDMLTDLNAQKDKFFSIIAHDLRSPFTSLLGFSQFLIEDYDELTEDEKKEYIKNIYDTLRNLLDLINNLFTWSRLQFSKADFVPEEIKLCDSINTVFNSIKISALNKKINLESICNENLIALVDKNMIETIIRNLVSNAIKFTKEKGSIKVTVLDNKEYLTVEIEDNGIGMSQEIAQKLFNLDANVTTRGTANEKGTGLGLIICKEFVEKHGGRIWVESEEEKGSRFIFTIPKPNQNINAVKS